MTRHLLAQEPGLGKSHVQTVSTRIVDQDQRKRHEGLERDRFEARQIASSVTGFLAVLAEWSRADIPERANENGDAATSKHEGGAR